MSSELKKSVEKKKKEMFEKSFLKFINNSGIEETMKNVRKNRYKTCNKRNKKRLLWYQNQTITQRYFFPQFISHRNEKKKVSQ